MKEKSKSLNKTKKNEKKSKESRGQEKAEEGKTEEIAVGDGKELKMSPKWREGYEGKNWGILIGLNLVQSQAEKDIKGIGLFYFLFPLVFISFEVDSSQQ